MLVSCAHRADSPADALGRFGAALETKDHATAYGLMSQAYRQRGSLAAFKTAIEEAGSYNPAAAHSLRQHAATLGARVQVPIGNDEFVALVREGRGWKIDEQPFSPYDQSTPRAALRSFVRAIEGRRYDVLLRLAPARYRAVVTTENLRAFWQAEGTASHKALLSELHLHMGARIFDEGDEAYMPYGAGRQVRFAREGGLWKIETPE